MSTYTKRGRSFKTQGTQTSKPQIIVKHTSNSHKLDFKQIEDNIIEFASFESKHPLAYDSKSIDKETFKGSVSIVQKEQSCFLLRCRNP